MSGFFSYHLSLFSYHLLRLNRHLNRRLSIWFAALMLVTACGAGGDPRAAEIPDLGSENNEQLSAGSETININTAVFEELQRIPHIGASMAEKIIEHRDKNGPFKRAEELMLIQGISDVRYRRIRHLIRVE